MSPRIKELSLIRLVFWMPKKEILVSLSRTLRLEERQWKIVSGQEWQGLLGGKNQKDYS